jgi:hypothetical protein
MLTPTSVQIPVTLSNTQGTSTSGVWTGTYTFASSGSPEGTFPTISQPLPSLGTWSIFEITATDVSSNVLDYPAASIASTYRTYFTIT